MDDCANTPPLFGTSWTERDRLLVEYYWLTGKDTMFIASAVDRTPKSVSELIRRFIRPGTPYKIVRRPSRPRREAA